MARWINVTQPFDYRWPTARAITAFTSRELGDQYVKDEVADFAVERGYASEGKATSSSRSRKGTGKRVTGSRRRKQEAPAAKAADTGSAAIVDNADDADVDRPADGPPVDNDAG